MFEQISKQRLNSTTAHLPLRDVTAVELSALVCMAILSLSGLATVAWAARPATGPKPIQLHPDNPHYFLWRGRPTVLITSGEHYGAVLNSDFDYKKYLRTLQSHGFNLTRTFTGAYCEPPGAFNIRTNTLAPANGRLVCPWARSDTPGYVFGGNRTLQSPNYADDIALRILNLNKTEGRLIFKSDFESNDLTGWRVSGNAPTITDSPARAGKYAMKTSLDRNKDEVAYRTEVSGPGSQVGKEYWYGFSIFLPDDYVPDNVWEIVAQWHGVPDFDVGEDWRNPVMALSTTGGKWGLVSRWDAKLNTFESGKQRYGGTKNHDLGPYRKGAWTDWVVHVRWSYRPDGLLQVWKDGKKVIEQKGPNAFNDKKGPYFKMGLYKGWKNPKNRSDAVTKRILYHDEFRMGAASAGYDDVAPNSPRTMADSVAAPHAED